MRGNVLCETVRPTFKNYIKRDKKGERQLTD